MQLSETDRLEAFSDGVMAVIITIMAFNDEAAGRSLALGAPRGSCPTCSSTSLSFAIVGTYWNNHHHLLRATERIGGAVMWANLHLLFWLSLMPIVTGWVGRYPLHALPAVVLRHRRARVGDRLLASGQDDHPCQRRDSSQVARAIGSDLKGNLSLALYAAGVAWRSWRRWCRTWSTARWPSCGSFPIGTWRSPVTDREHVTGDGPFPN